jgi:AcrR family transcriptional regulator
MGNSKSTRERILDTGMAMASQSGLESVTLGVLASNVDMSKSGLFAHFHSKEACKSAYWSTPPISSRPESPRPR